MATVAVLGRAASERLFGEADPIGRYVLVENVPFRVIGELDHMSDSDSGLSLVMPYSTAARRVFGSPHPEVIQVKVEDSARIGQTVDDITQVLESAHRARDFRQRGSAHGAHARRLRQRDPGLALYRWRAVPGLYESRAGHGDYTPARRGTGDGRRR